MNDRLNVLLGQIRQLEAELVAGSRQKETEFCYHLRSGTAQFTEAAKAAHKRLRTDWQRYLLHSRFLVILTSPVIWMCIVPIALADLVGSVYQAICFPIYGIPKVHRRGYMAFDRHRLTYLNFFEKVNCEYCAYVNGILAYFTEIAARTEQHWCPIKHAACAKCMHSRYQKFVDFGDAATYRRRIDEIRQAFADIDAKKGRPKTP